MKMNERINNNERRPAITTVEKRSFCACVKMHPNLITWPNYNGKKGKSVSFGHTLAAVFTCNLNIYLLFRFGSL